MVIYTHSSVFVTPNAHFTLNSVFFCGSMASSSETCMLSKLGYSYTCDDLWRGFSVYFLGFTRIAVGCAFDRSSPLRAKMTRPMVTFAFLVCMGLDYEDVYFPFFFSQNSKISLRPTKTTSNGSKTNIVKDVFTKEKVFG